MRSAWTAVWIIVLGLGIAGGGAYLIYKHRLRVSILYYIHLVLVVLFNY